MMYKINYKHLVEKPNLCGPACIQMILLRRGIWIDQEEIAKELDNKVRKKDLKKYKVKLKTTSNKDNLGISFKDFKNKKIKTFLAKQNLKAETFYASKIKDAEKFVKVNLEKQNDIIINFYMKYFEKNKDWGHFSLISSISGHTIAVIDPEPSNKSEWKTTIKELTEAMGKQFDGRERGFIVVN